MTTSVLQLYTALASHAESLSELAQVEIASAASASKSSAGDAALVSLARRSDLSEPARAVIAASPRAAVKAAWLSRPDHAPGYVQSQIASERRTKVLAAVAGHPDASDELVAQIARTGTLSVALAVLGRENAPEGAVADSLVAILRSSNRSYAQERLVTQTVAAHPDIWEDLARRAPGEPRVWQQLLRVNGFVFPADMLPALTQALVVEPVAELATRRYFAYGGSPASEAEALLAQPGWEIGSDLDRVMAQAAEDASERVQRLSGEWRNCWLRFFGTPEQQEQAAKDAAALAARVERAATVSDDDAIMEYVNEVGARLLTPLSGALERNPHVRLRHLLAATHYRFPASLQSVLIAREDDPVVVAAYRLASGDFAAADALVAQLPVADRGAAVDLALAAIRGSSSLPAHVLARLLMLPTVSEVVGTRLFLSEITAVMENPYVPAEVRPALASRVADRLAELLPDAQSWRTFTPLVDEVHDTLERAATVATAL